MTSERRSIDGGPGLITAAGAVLWRPGPDGPEVAVVHRPKKSDWSFPKGKPEPGESLEQTARREVFEETGMVPVLGTRLPAVRYRKGWHLKRVDYWSATVDGPAEFVANNEVDDLAWLTVPAARARLSYARDKRLLDAFARNHRHER
jgi:8-oxo-dGTP diphosphatase